MNSHEINTLLPDSSVMIAQSSKAAPNFWPLTNQQRFLISEHVTNACMQFLDQKCGSDLGDLALLNFGVVFSKARHWCELGELLQLERIHGFSVAGQSNDLADLRGIIAGKSTVLSAVVEQKKAPRSFGFLLKLRAFARRLTFSRPSDLPFNVFRKSQTFAISHNELLIADARQKGLNHKFIHADTILKMIRKLPEEKADPQLETDINEAARGLSEHISQCLNTDEDVCRAVKSMLRSQIKSSLMEACMDWNRAKLASFIPMSLFCGTGGGYAVRLICMASSRRGGHITTYGHGYFSGLAGQAESFLISDVCIADDFVVETQHCASNLIRQLNRLPYKQIQRARVRGFDGMSPIKVWINQLERYTLNTKSPKILYLPTVLLGARQLFPPLLPDAVYLGWQFKLAQEISDAGFDLTIRPHPEGAYKGKSHPLGGVFKIERRFFEHCLLDYDILVFDYGQSTTFAKALCTKMPMIYLHLGTSIHSPKVTKLISQRCAKLDVDFDTNNNPIVPSIGKILDAAVANATKVNIGQFQKILMGAN
jgi:hypothetical protein